MAAAAIWNYKNFNFCHEAVIAFNIWCSVPSFIKIGQFSLRYGDLTIFKMVQIFKLDFENFQFLSCGLCRHDVLLPGAKFPWYRMIGWWVMAKKAIFKMAAVTISNFKNFNFWSRDCNRVQYLMLCTKFHWNRKIFTEIWQYNDFQNGGRPTSWILKICNFCHAAVVSMPFCFLVQNFADIGQSVDE